MQPSLGGVPSGHHHNMTWLPVVLMEIWEAAGPLVILVGPVIGLLSQSSQALGCRLVGLKVLTQTDVQANTQPDCVILKLLTQASPPHPISINYEPTARNLCKLTSASS